MATVSYLFITSKVPTSPRSSAQLVTAQLRSQAIMHCVQISFNFRIFASPPIRPRPLVNAYESNAWVYYLRQQHHAVLNLQALHLLSTVPMGISLPPPYCAYKQSFNMRPFVVPKISLDDKRVINNHPPSHHVNLTAHSLSCAEELTIHPAHSVTTLISDVHVLM